MPKRERCGLSRTYTKRPKYPQLEKCIQIIEDLHSNQTTYAFGQEAQTKFEEYHNNLRRQKLAILNDEDRHGIITKAIGQMAQVSMSCICWTLLWERHFKNLEKTKTSIRNKFASTPPEEKLEAIKQSSKQSSV